MRNKKIGFLVLAAAAMAVCSIVLLTPLEAQQTRSAIAAVAIDSDDIGGVVTSTKGPEGGVWVIAQTADLPAKFTKIVVTDDRGRYLLPDLPKANYRLWVRGYGLLDSRPVQATPGKIVSLTAVLAPNERAAAQYYPASYWYSLLRVPQKGEFPLEGVESQLKLISSMKAAMQLIQVGDKATREIPEPLRKFKSSTDAWEAWRKTGESPINSFTRDISPRLLVKMYADWTDRIAAGEYPTEAPPRPEGVERNAVISQWDWSTDKAFIHDVISTDGRNPTVNANGPIYGPEQFSADVLDILNPNTNTWTTLPVPMRDHNMEPSWQAEGTGRGQGPVAPLTWGNENVRPAQMRLHNPMMDQHGRVWLTGKFRKGTDQPDFCKEGSSHPSAKFYPLARNNDLQVELYDPKAKKFTMIDTCFGTHHLQFAEDADNTLWFSGGADVIGWVNTKTFDETHDEAKAQGWCPYLLDTNGNGKIDEYVGPNDPVDPAKDKRIRGRGYGLAVNPVDGSIWQGMGTGFFPGYILRVEPGKTPPFTCKTEIYNSPAGTSLPKSVYTERRTGIVWVGFSGSGTLGKFDRRKCKVLNGPTATGDHCQEGWTVYAMPGPGFKGVTDAISSDWPYLNWVDQFDTLGLGRDVSLTPGTNSDSVVAFLPESEKFVVLRVPYPLGFYTRGMDGRIDDPTAGWKGRALWATYASISPWNYEGGKGQHPKAVKLQIRPDPLAK